MTKLLICELKNDNDRKIFLSHFEKWGLWFDEPKLNVMYYRIQLPNELFLIAEISKNNLFEPSVHYRLISCFTNILLSESEALRYLKKFRGTYAMLTSKEICTIEKIINKNNKNKKTIEITTLWE